MTVWRTFAIAMMMIIILLGLGMMVLAQEQRRCFPAAAAPKMLEDALGERIAFIGQGRTGEAVILSMSPDGGWTILHVRDGVACIAAGGDAYSLTGGRET